MEFAHGQHRSVLHAGPLNPSSVLQPGIGFYQNFTFQLSQYQPAGPIFTLTHFCLAGVCWVPVIIGCK
ncbi:hypothetical protein J3R82DRAFT_4808 [Butyriboletus roseoflavus]|nr:hypothetical protein J3R82DRAFT_4808 [Butyriboletus roseoflavus]